MTWSFWECMWVTLWVAIIAWGLRGMNLFSRVHTMNDTSGCINLFAKPGSRDEEA